MPQLNPKTVSVYSDSPFTDALAVPRIVTLTNSIAAGGDGEFMTINRQIPKVTARSARTASAPWSAHHPPGHSLDYAAAAETAKFIAIQFGRQEALTTTGDPAIVQFADDMRWMEDACRYNGRQPIFVTYPVMPTTFGWSAAQRARLNDINFWIASSSVTKNVPLVDLRSMLISGSEIDTSNYTYLSPAGEHRMGVEIGRQIKSILTWYS